ncbi:MAG TPA: four helix bundle protein [Planctomycetota bacterium]|nr:four helix bundle protein [Planctomycetota bacterium]HRT96651.1 four helix bundle protein [Planctomycetota bacterium]
MRIQSYRDLDVWQRGMGIAKQAYQLTKRFPREELYGVTSQVRRAASSIPANTAEGWGRHYPAEFIQFLRKANGSRTGLETHLLLSAEVGLCTQEQVEPLLTETEILGKQLLSLERSLGRRTAK